MRTPERGDVIHGKYEVTGTLGQGGMGVVLEARHRVLNELVALKFFLAALPTRPERVNAFALEARAGMRIKSQHVARVHDVDTFEGAPFIVMERLEGQDLAACLRQRGRIPLREAIDLVMQACEAVNEAHVLGIVHRDLKPGNLFLAVAPGGITTVKVLDFGIARDADGASAVSAAVVGSPQYMSPEQLKDPAKVDARADVWAFGVIVYEMLTGRPPFRGETAPAVHMAILNGRYAPLSSLCPDVPPLVVRAVDDALRLDPRERIPSIEAFASRLAGFGSPAADSSLDVIQRVVERASLPQSTPPPDAEARPRGEPTEPGRVTETFGPSSNTKPAPARRWSGPAAVAFAILAVTGVGVGALRALRATSAPSVAGASSSAGPCAAGATAPCEAACAAREAGACHALAKALEHGVGAPADLARAATLYQAECDAGGFHGCNNLAGLYARGAGVPHDDARAAALYKKGCDGGDGTACVNLGSMHFDGEGLLKDPELGARLFLRGCEKGEPLGCLDLSAAYSRGAGVPQDPARAVALAEKACSGGAADGCVRVATAKLSGDGVDKDVKGGVAQLDAMCARGQPAGCLELSSLYAQGRGSDVLADAVRMREYAGKACALGDKRGCAEDDALSRQDSTGTTPAQAVALFQAKCESGSMVACGLLGQSLVKSADAAERAKGEELLARATAPAAAATHLAPPPTTASGMAAMVAAMVAERMKPRALTRPDLLRSAISAAMARGGGKQSLSIAYDGPENERIADEIMRAVGAGPDITQWISVSVSPSWGPVRPGVTLYIMSADKRLANALADGLRSAGITDVEGPVDASPPITKTATITLTIGAKK